MVRNLTARTPPARREAEETVNRKLLLRRKTISARNGVIIVSISRPLGLTNADEEGRWTSYNKHKPYRLLHLTRTSFSKTRMEYSQ